MGTGDEILWYFLSHKGREILNNERTTIGRRLTTGRNYDQQKKRNKLIINQDVLLRTPITQVRRHIDDGRPD
jgi:hypothetical protein